MTDTTTPERSKQMFSRSEDLARSHRLQLRRRSDHQQSSRLALARMLYGANGR